MPQDWTFESSTGKAIPFWRQDLLNPNRPQVLLVQGMRGGGKGVTVDMICQQFHNKGLMVVHCWGARDYENYFYAINRDCKHKWDNAKSVLSLLIKFEDKMVPIDGVVAHFKDDISREECEEVINQMIDKRWVISEPESGKIQIDPSGIMIVKDEPLHCNCNSGIDITIGLPDYVDIDQASLDAFNDVHWNSWKNYNDAYIKGDVDTFLPDSPYIDWTKRKKSSDIGKKFRPRIVIKKFTCPNGAKPKETFREQWFKLLNESRAEHRIVVVNPRSFLSANDKFNTLEQIVRLIPDYNDLHCIPLSVADVGKPRYLWTKWQKSFPKVLYAINELRSVSPSSALSGEKDSGKTKKAIYDYIPEARHFNSWFIGDYQNPNDLYPSVRYQADIVIIKRASRELLGDDWTKLFDKIHKVREKEFAKWGFDEGNAPLKIRKRVDRLYPKIEELPDNKGYATNPATDFKLLTINTPTFHHKGEQDNFWAITGIKKTINRKKVVQTSSADDTSKESATEKKSKIKNTIFERMLIDKEEGMPIIKILEKYQLEESKEAIANIGLGKLTNKTFSNNFNRWERSRKPSADETKPPKTTKIKVMPSI